MQFALLPPHFPLSKQKSLTTPFSANFQDVQTPNPLFIKGELMGTNYKLWLLLIVSYDLMSIINSYSAVMLSAVMISEGIKVN